MWQVHSCSFAARKHKSSSNIMPKTLVLLLPTNLCSYHQREESYYCCTVVRDVEDFANLLPVLEQDDRVGQHIAGHQRCVGSHEPRVPPGRIPRDLFIVQNAVDTNGGGQYRVDGRVYSETRHKFLESVPSWRHNWQIVKYHIPRIPIYFIRAEQSLECWNVLLREPWSNDVKYEEVKQATCKSILKILQVQILEESIEVFSYFSFHVSKISAHKIMEHKQSGVWLKNSNVMSEQSW